MPLRLASSTLLHIVLDTFQACVLCLVVPCYCVSLSTADKFWQTVLDVVHDCLCCTFKCHSALSGPLRFSFVSCQHIGTSLQTGVCQH